MVDAAKGWLFRRAAGCWSWIVVEEMIRFIQLYAAKCRLRIRASRICTLCNTVSALILWSIWKIETIRKTGSSCANGTISGSAGVTHFMWKSLGSGRRASPETTDCMVAMEELFCQQEDSDRVLAWQQGSQRNVLIMYVYPIAGCLWCWWRREEEHEAICIMSAGLVESFEIRRNVFNNATLNDGCVTILKIYVSH